MIDYISLHFFNLKLVVILNKFDQLKNKLDNKE